MIIEILDLARDDLAAGFEFYENNAAGISRYFLTHLYQDIESLSTSAGAHRQIHRDFYRALSRKFPFAIYYRLNGDRVLVHAVVDCRRHPSWIARHLRKT
ncbi:type II toxin-antitoxin system RelE/ParE family toxin [Synoicihabitans lomoniglobus]|uniref:Type II toxin-antitoxin system RelE/ParE family toxin n=1 Tax=Synoicihabitans lomoniglobus TaxID=2909285 RepID=A0AAF0CN22_9BACT|nr:type II toxin-antitoxin system RelE/ParE family toxin [Opitutaceae bacterium LMO-M01]WED63860.1 type II toxin-antitoxin system RelE/ParE family toxin [Opitutaceae bacterium LMO-M01]